MHWRSTKKEEQKNIKGEQTCLSSLWLVCYMLSVFIYNTHITKSNHCFVVPCCETCPQASDAPENDVTTSVYQWLYCSTVSFSAACASGSKTRHRFLPKSVLVKIYQYSYRLANNSHSQVDNCHLASSGLFFSTLQVLTVLCKQIDLLLLCI